MQKLGRNSAPFSTTNAILAFSLRAAGMPFADPHWPCKNEYTVETLRKLGFSGSVDLLETVKAAVKTKKRGTVRYLFENSAKLSSFLKIYRQQEAEIEADGKPIEMDVFQLGLMNKVASGAMDPQEALLRLNCVTLKLRVQFTEMWMRTPGILIVDNPGKSQTVETASGTVVRHPGRRAVSTNASEETLRRLGFK